jgi:cell division control protein CDC15
LEVHKDLDHRHIVKFFDSIKEENVGAEGVLVLVLEYVEMGSLHDLMKRGKLERCRILTNVAQILKGLDYLHNFSDRAGARRPIVHRDLRCANVLMTADKTLKIADFGLCKRLHEMAEASGIASRMGNPYWNAPELVDRSKRVGQLNWMSNFVLSLSNVNSNKYHCRS